MVYSIFVIAAHIFYAFMVNVIQALKPRAAATGAPAVAGSGRRISSESAWTATSVGVASSSCSSGSSFGASAAVQMQDIQQQMYYRRLPRQTGNSSLSSLAEVYTA